MGVLNDEAIRQLSEEGWTTPNPKDGGASALLRRMIDPLAEGKRRPGVISFGVSSYGYDFRVAGEFELFSPSPDDLHAIDPKNFSVPCEKVYCREGEPFVMPPHSFALGVSLEKFCIPRDLLTICLGKSTYARCGLYVNITPFEPEWEGYATVELTNPTPRPLYVYPYEGIAQLVFLQAGLHHQEFANYIREATFDTDIVHNPDAWPGPFDTHAGRLICRRSYADKQGKYNNQPSRIVHPKVDGARP